MAQLREVVEEADRAARQRGAEDRQRRHRVVRDGEERDRRRRDDQQAAHRRRALLGRVVLRPLLADLLAELVPAQERDEPRAGEDRDDHRDQRGSEDACHYADKFSATTSSPTESEPFTSTMSPGRSVGPQPHGRLAGRRDPLAAVAARASSPTAITCSTPESAQELPDLGVVAPAPAARARPSRRAPPPAGGRRRAPRGAGAPHASTSGSRCSSRSARARRRRAGAPPRGASRTRRCSSPSGSGTPRLSAVADGEPRVRELVARAVYAVANGSGASRSTRSTTMSVRCRYGSSSGSSAARSRRRRPQRRRAARPSPRRRSRSLPRNSRCTGPMFVITTMSGLVNDASHSICPRPRMRELGDAHLGVRARSGRA